MLWIALLSEIIFKRETVGFGDVKLIVLIRAFSIFSLFGGCYKIKIIKFKSFVDKNLQKKI